VNNEATCEHFKDKFFARNFWCDSFRNLTIFMRRNSIYLDGAELKDITFACKVAVQKY